MATKKTTQQKVKVTFKVDSYPQETKEIYICGNCSKLGDWDCNKAIKMKKNEDNIFELVMFLNKDLGELEYKYLQKKHWDSVECDNANSSTVNRVLNTLSSKTNIIATDQITGFTAV